MLNDYLYNCHSTRGDKVYWRCHNYSRKIKEERCRARCVIVDGKLSALTGSQHNHPPHTEKIDKINKRNQLLDENASMASGYPKALTSTATASHGESFETLVDTSSLDLGLIKIEVLPFAKLGSQPIEL